MVALSNVPGRLRLKSVELLGRPVLCRRVEAAVLQVSGVTYAEASHRTGTLLLVHDGERAVAASLIAEARRSLDACATSSGPASSPVPVPEERESVREAARELAWHGLRMMLPAPWSSLLPVVPIARRLFTAQGAAVARNTGHRNGRARGR